MLECSLPESRSDEAQVVGFINAEVVRLSSPSRSHVEEPLYEWSGNAVIALLGQ